MTLQQVIIPLEKGNWVSVSEICKEVKSIRRESVNRCLRTLKKHGEVERIKLNLRNYKRVMKKIGKINYFLDGDNLKPDAIKQLRAGTFCYKLNR